MSVKNGFFTFRTTKTKETISILKIKTTITTMT